MKGGQEHKKWDEGGGGGGNNGMAGERWGVGGAFIGAEPRMEILAQYWPVNECSALSLSRQIS